MVLEDVQNFFCEYNTYPSFEKKCWTINFHFGKIWTNSYPKKNLFNLFRDFCCFIIAIILLFWIFSLGSFGRILTCEPRREEFVANNHTIFFCFQLVCNMLYTPYFNEIDPNEKKRKRFVEFWQREGLVVFLCRTGGLVKGNSNQMLL